MGVFPQVDSIVNVFECRIHRRSYSILLVTILRHLIFLCLKRGREIIFIRTLYRVFYRHYVVSTNITFDINSISQDFPLFYL